MDDRQPSRPEPVWGVIRAALQAATGVAFLLEDLRTIGLLLLVLAGATFMYETTGVWRRRRARRAADAGSPRPTTVEAPVGPVAVRASSGRAGVAAPSGSDVPQRRPTADGTEALLGRARGGRRGVGRAPASRRPA